MNRRTLILALPLISVLILSAHSYFCTDAISIALSDKSILQIFAHRGAIHANLHLNDPSRPARGFGGTMCRTDFGDGMVAIIDQNAAYHLHFGSLLQYASGGNAYFWAISIPLWLIGMLVAVPLLRIVFQRRRATLRQREGLCARCGYDLRASPARCSECGHAQNEPSPERVWEGGIRL